MCDEKAKPRYFAFRIKRKRTTSPTMVRKFLAVNNLSTEAAIYVNERLKESMGYGSYLGCNHAHARKVINGNFFVLFPPYLQACDLFSLLRSLGSSRNA